MWDGENEIQRSLVRMMGAEVGGAVLADSDMPC